MFLIYVMCYVLFVLYRCFASDYPVMLCMLCYAHVLYPLLGILFVLFLCVLSIFMYVYFMRVRLFCMNDRIVSYVYIRIAFQTRLK
jgi:hypothetical protein